MGCNLSSRSWTSFLRSSVQVQDVNWKIQPTSKLEKGRFIKCLLGILNIFLSLKHLEDFILQNQNQIPLEILKNCIGPKTQERDWIGELSEDS